MIAAFSGVNRFLSNMWRCHVEYQGISFPSVENAYHRAKISEEMTSNIGDLPLYNALVQNLRLCSPIDAKKIGYNVRIKPNWVDLREGVMRGLLEAKFQAPGLRKLLLDTGDEYLMEGNYWHDRFWGVCTCKACWANDAPQGNTLGRMLMELRDSLKGDSECCSPHCGSSRS